MNTETDILLPSKLFFSYPDGECFLLPLELSNTSTKITLDLEDNKLKGYIPAEMEREDLPLILKTCAYYLDGAHCFIRGVNKKPLPDELLSRW